MSLSCRDDLIRIVYAREQELTPRYLRGVEPRRRRRRLGGALGNAHLTSLTGIVLVVLLAVEGATIPFLRHLLSVHIFVGMLLLGPVALKLGSTGYRFARYYLGADDFVRAGPPVAPMRFFVAPVLVVSTITLFTTGVILLAVPHRGLVLGLHKASFAVWFGATAIHVLAYTGRALRHLVDEILDRRTRGVGTRALAIVLSLAIGAAVALGTYSLATPWLQHAFDVTGN
ncbi:MAG TPA: hypothetical protein VMU73_11670 [Gaiellaceae bacterium]|nr:hypothetical protein [Gaiellaceae bacterium]